MSSTVRELLNSLHAAATDEERRSWAAASARALGLGGIAVTLVQELVWFSDATSARIEDLQFILGQGPSRLFREDEREVREVPDLGRVLTRQWPQFAAEAEALGIAALFVWPVRIGAVQVGTMTGYRRAPGPLTALQSTHGRLVADALAQQVLNRWPKGDTGAAPARAGTVGLHRAEVHQATGVLSEKLGVTLAEALDRLRAQAYASGESLSETAHRVIQRELPHDPN
ncbi:ANTAR domain-containing protein [Streptomyces sp. NPDC046939]|uniref:ANTAR domain-containing protein n=1 Tax=Streptomyces sp. NPDC046939 TaxID=3155376 RepID=UPI0033F066D2